MGGDARAALFDMERVVGADGPLLTNLKLRDDSGELAESPGGVGVGVGGVGGR